MRITVDYREKASGLIDLLQKEDISLNVKKIPYGDYIIGNSITIERKTARDLLISIIDGIGKVSAEKIREVLDGVCDIK